MSADNKLISVVVADDHPIVLSGLASLLQTDQLFLVVATCSDGSSALRVIREAKPNLAVLDISMPGLTGLEVLAAVKSDGLGTKVVFLTGSATDEQIVKAVAHGACGIMLKEAAADSLLECLHKVAAGEPWIPADLIDAAVERESGRRVEANRLEMLTAREKELALWIAEGLSNKVIARRASVSEGTVKIHLHNIYQKVGVPNRTALAAVALTHLDHLRTA